TFVSISESGFAGTGDELRKHVAGSTEVFSLVLAGLKAFLEHNIRLNLVAERDRRMKKISLVVLTLLGVLSSAPVGAGQAPADHHAASTPGATSAQGCEKLASLALPHARVTTAQLVAPGAFKVPNAGRGGAVFAQLPAFCRVAATLPPSPDSLIEMEIWLPAENWNGKFLAVGNGGWAGTISYDAMAAGLRRGYAAASNDTGHSDNGASFAVNQDKLVDFAYRAMHE